MSSTLEFHLRDEAPAPSNSTTDDPSAISYITLVDDGLALLYALLAVVAIIQLIRIQVRLPHVRWTTQKNFLSFNLLTASLRSIVFACRSEVENVVKVSHPTWYLVLVDGPGLLFFSTFTLLILFWAEIYYQATVGSQLCGASSPSNAPGSPRAGSGDSGSSQVPAPPPQKRIFILANVLAYLVFAGIVLANVSSDGKTGLSSLTVRQQTAILFSCLAVITAYLFLLYGARLFILLRRFPIDSRGRRSKLREIGTITAIACSCFTVRSFLLVESVVNASGRLGGLDVMSHPVLNGVYYLVCEVLPMALVMYILRKLPPKARDDGRGGHHASGREGRVHIGVPRQGSDEERGVGQRMDDRTEDVRDLVRTGDIESASGGNEGGLEEPLLQNT